MSSHEVLSDAAPWPSRGPELGTVTVERGQGHTTDSAESLEKWNPELLQRQTARAEECNRRIQDYDKAIAEAKRVIEFNEDQKQQQQVHLSNALVVIAKQRGLQPVLKPVDSSARDKFLFNIGRLYSESAFTGKDVTFTMPLDLLELLANDSTPIENRGDNRHRTYCSGVFGRGSVYGEFTVKDAVAKARSLQGLKINVLKNEMGLA